jgi:hypothetical protein
MLRILVRVLGITPQLRRYRQINDCEEPQTNGFVEQIHQVISSSIRAIELYTKAFDDTTINTVLQNVAYGLRATNHSSLSASPCQLVFGRDMVINAINLANWKALSER